MEFALTIIAQNKGALSEKVSAYCFTSNWPTKVGTLFCWLDAIWLWKVIVIRANCDTDSAIFRRTDVWLFLFDDFLRPPLGNLVIVRAKASSKLDRSRKKTFLGESLSKAQNMSPEMISANLESVHFPVLCVGEGRPCRLGYIVPWNGTDSMSPFTTDDKLMQKKILPLHILFQINSLSWNGYRIINQLWFKSHFN